MTQFNLADELRRGGTGLLAQAVADLIDAMPGWDAQNHERWLLDLQARAAAVSAGNQAKAPTALDEMRALQEGGGMASCGHGYSPRSLLCVQCHPTPENLGRVAAEREEAIRELAVLRAFHDVYVGSAEEETVRQRDEAREALARVEAERDEQDSYIATLEEQLTAARRGLAALDKAASEAEVTASPELCCSCGHVASRHMATFAQCYEPECRCQQMRVVFALNPSDPEATESAPREG